MYSSVMIREKITQQGRTTHFWDTIPDLIALPGLKIHLSEQPPEKLVLQEPIIHFWVLVPEQPRQEIIIRFLDLLLAVRRQVAITHLSAYLQDGLQQVVCQTLLWVSVRVMQIQQQATIHLLEE